MRKKITGTKKSIESYKVTESPKKKLEEEKKDVYLLCKWRIYLSDRE